MIFPDLPLKTILLVLLGVAIIGASLFFGVRYYGEHFGGGIDATAYAIVAACERTPGDHSPCYESEIPNLYPKFSVPQLFDIVREIRVLDPSYQFCHVLAHKIGNKVVAEDPNNWLDVIPLNPADGLCSNGFIHGVFEGRFGADVLDDATIGKFMPEFKEACEPHSGWQPSDLDRAICYHGMGHLADFITNANIPKALSICSKVAPSEYQRVCVQGVFMQIYQPLEPDDYALIAQMKVKPSTTTVQTYCARYSSDPMAQGSCIEESWPLQQPHIADGTAVAKLCSWEPNGEEKTDCYIAMSSIIGRMSLGVPQKAVAACNAFPESELAICFSYSAEAVLEENRNDARPAISLCGQAPQSAVQQCVSQLVDHAQFMFGSNQGELNTFCAALPAEYRSECESSGGNG